MPKSPIKNAVGPTIRKLRNRKGWTQEELAAKLQIEGWDCTRSWLARIEARQVQVKEYELLYFQKLFGVELEELFPTLIPKKADPRLRSI
ncbi:MAG TPA: helix-turn-helix transcriptional regulator [Verrucomicrobiae bacterium]|nr:helix-turn-helix transcriptional regulator [Verrucomicrobiae bacterium]